MSQKGYPISDISRGAWVNESSGTTLYPSIDEPVGSEDWNDWIQSGGLTDDQCEVRLTSLQSPGATRTGHIVVTGYGKLYDESAETDLVITLVCGTTVIETWTLTDSIPAGLTDNHTIATGNASNINDYTNLRLRFKCVNPIEDDLIWVAFSHIQIPDAPLVSSSQLTLLGVG